MRKIFILVTSDGKILPFTECKIYVRYNRYIALYEKGGACILCRCLNEEERELFKKVHLIYDCTKEPLTNTSVGAPVMIITTKAKSFEDTDRLVEEMVK